MKNLPKYHVSTIEADYCTGTYEPSKLVGERWIACLNLGKNSFVWGRFINVSPENLKANFKPKNIGDLARISINSSYLYLDSYWGERAEIVLDSNRVWQKTEFKPSDAAERTIANGKWVRKLTSNTRSNEKVVKDGWDHEHCAICWETISKKGQRFAFVSNQDDWVCESCYGQYVSARSIDFIIDEQIR